MRAALARGARSRWDLRLGADTASIVELLGDRCEDPEQTAAYVGSERDVVQLLLELGQDSEDDLLPRLMMILRIFSPASADFAFISAPTFAR